ncbi:MAG: hypothetical protein UX31_C0016G0011 [Candidatus Nomurabacteria bacterium GW2011_GWA1_46_11]|uniref:Uncharacterized protein n=1 Tax=Candidatus Nomurabacteria bacterium GW2011_GWA1_46_11 TaxID=1618732 RepID=A0A0G1NLR3_9BACT|nr:MAG: hypothetical protein UW69_C0012G0011 [Microgenomates group bacterium GW2011_GWA2_44_7]KKT77381.1 MAG: hypothetical protein UW73_C0021G0014 [Microgenomates group bacterium GW2011_GWB1_44_8]KKU21534.1 MAG: hypothetical protein UX31_C0016G0011 [Candidatus Nomurabacteria bacterium GW2011_GWA1_46_11]
MTNLERISIGPITKMPESEQLSGPRDKNGVPRMKGICWSEPTGIAEGQTIILDGKVWKIAVVGFQEGRGYAGVRGHPEPTQAELVFPVAGIGRMQISSQGSFSPEATITHALVGPLKPEQIATAELTLTLKDSGPDGKVSDRLILDVTSGSKTWEIPPVMTPVGVFHRTVISPNSPLTYFVVKLEPVS